MGNIEIFSSTANFMTTFITLLILLFAVIYAGQDSKIGKGLWFLFSGLFLEFITSWVGFKITEYYNAGASINFLVFLELLMLLISMIFLALSASQILVNNVPEVPVISAITVIGLAAIVFFVFITPDGSMVANMRFIFPLAGFAYISASFWSQKSHQFNAGFITAGVITAVVAFFIGLKLVGVEYVMLKMWYLPALTYISLAVAVMMMKVDMMAKKVEAGELEIEKYNRRIEEIIKSSPFPIIISRLSDDRLILANNNAVKLFGIQPTEIERYRLKDFFADSENRKLLNERLEQEKEVQDFEILVKAFNGDTPFWLLTSANIIDYNYDIALYAAFQDITSRKNREALLKNQAIRDPLTSLYNRRYFEEEVSKKIGQARTTGGSYSVLMIDADHFKRVNDTYGHKIGDKVLIELSSTCERALRDNDIVARYGGEEFVIFLPDIDAEKARTVADRLRETIAKIVVYSDDNEPIHFTVSIGISSSEVSDNIDMLIKTADEALYRAKENGRNRSEIFTRADLDNFHADENSAHKDQASQLHPIFAKEENQEISLLDGIGANHITEENTNIEEKEKDDGYYPILGIDDEDLK